MNIATKLTLACAAAVGIASAVVIWIGVLPILVLVPMFLLASLYGPLAFGVFLVPGLAMLAWHPGLLSRTSRPPMRSSVLAALLATGQLLWFVIAWDHGLKYWGFWYCITLLAANLAVTGLVLVVERTLRRNPTFPGNLLFHSLLFGWAATIAFPWLGELP